MNLYHLLWTHGSKINTQNYYDITDQIHPPLCAPSLLASEKCSIVLAFNTFKMLGKRKKTGISKFPMDRSRNPMLSVLCSAIQVYVKYTV